MIYIIMKSYFVILLSVGTGSLILLAMGLYWIFKPRPQAILTTPRVPEATRSEPSIESLVTAASTLTDMRSTLTPLVHSRSAITVTSGDINAIAGEDVLATQLDLARAYIETGRKQLAKKILEYVVDQGSHAQQQEAQHLITLL